MSEFEQVRIALAGSTGLVGRHVIANAAALGGIALLALARRDVPAARNTLAETFVAPPARWGEGLAAFQPHVLICALGTTWRKAGASADAFRAVDHELVLRTAEAARSQGATRCVLISSAGADLRSRSFYLRVKGEVERDLRRIGFDRLDVLRPGLLRGERGAERRVGERTAIVLSPLTDLFLRGRLQQYRAIDADAVARAALAFARRMSSGTFIHDNRGINQAAGLSGD